MDEFVTLGSDSVNDTFPNFNLGGIYMRPGRTQTGMNSGRYEIFATVYMKPGRNAWCLVSGQNDVFCQINISLTQKHTGLKFLDPV